MIKTILQKKRVINKPNKVLVIVKPVKTQSISINNLCLQNCQHCKGYFLKLMDQQNKIDLKNYSSFLISGGSNKNGQVKIDYYLLEMLKKKQKKINIHVGLISEVNAKRLSKYVDVVSFDFISDTKIIKTIYNLNKTEEDVIRTYLILKKYCRVVPHVMIGFGNEKRSINLLNKLGENRVCFIIYLKHPKVKNDMQEPSNEYIEDILKYARKVFDKPKKLILGCMRPINRKKEIDTIAVKYVDVIVNPYNKLNLSNYDLIYRNQCCSFYD